MHTSFKRVSAESFPNWINSEKRQYLQKLIFIRNIEFRLIPISNYQHILDGIHDLLRPFSISSPSLKDIRFRCEYRQSLNIGLSEREFILIIAIASVTEGKWSNNLFVEQPQSLLHLTDLGRLVRG